MFIQVLQTLLFLTSKTEWKRRIHEWDKTEGASVVVQFLRGNLAWRSSLGNRMKVKGRSGGVWDLTEWTCGRWKELQREKSMQGVNVPLAWQDGVLVVCVTGVYYCGVLLWFIGFSHYSYQQQLWAGYHRAEMAQQFESRLDKVGHGRGLSYHGWPQSHGIVVSASRKHDR